MIASIFVIIFAAFSVTAVWSLKEFQDEKMPAPFYRVLSLTTPYQTGNDVLIAQTLLSRDAAVRSLRASGSFDEATEEATIKFQLAHGLSKTGKFDSATAQKALDYHSLDNYHDSGFTAKSLGYKYKFNIPVHSNRSVETKATLYDENNNILLQFQVRTHGYRSDGTAGAWPDFGTGDNGLTEFSSNGNSITGLLEVDLNSPEPNPQVYGPWPVNRFVRGLEGNAQLMLPNIRDGILLHTGNWTTSTAQWDETKDMPNSSGCVHAHPADVEKIYKLLVGLGVTVNDNPFSGKNYPYQPQGIAVIENIDKCEKVRN